MTYGLGDFDACQKHGLLQSCRSCSGKRRPPVGQGSALFNMNAILGRLKKKGNTDQIRVQLQCDRSPLGGWSGYVLMVTGMLVLVLAFSCKKSYPQGLPGPLSQDFVGIHSR